MKTLPARILALLAFLCCGSSLLAEPPTKQATLTQIQLFAFGGIGVAGTTSAGELLYRQVLASEQAEAQFLALVKNGTPAAKCYALVGLRAKNRAAFEEQADALAKDPSIAGRDRFGMRTHQTAARLHRHPDQKRRIRHVAEGEQIAVPG